jgi:competence protein ComEC
MAWERASSPSKGLFLILLVFIVGLSTKAIFFSKITSSSIRDFVGKEVVMTGTIAGEIIQRESAQEATLKDVEIGGERQKGKILARLPKFQIFFLGDILEFRCELVVPEPFEGFDYAVYLENRGVYAVCYRLEELVVQGKAAWRATDYLLLLRLAMIERLGKIFPEPHAAFMSGVLFGGSGGLSEDLKGDFSRTGLSHVMAASGYNVSIFSSMLLTLLMRSALGRRRAIVVSGLFVIFYIFLAGATPPVIRAGIMAATVMLGVWLGRKPHAGNLLLLSAFLMMIFNPKLIIDVGFQLSFGATAGLMLFGNWFGERIKFIPEIFGLRESCAASLAAILATLPIMLWHFGTISLVAPLVNLLVLPWIPYLMLLGGVALGLGWLLLPLGTIAAIPAAALSSLILLLINWFAAFDFASVSF